MSRAKEASIAHVVTDEVLDEPAGYHPLHGARQVLEAVLAKDELVSAADWMRAAEAARTDPALIADRYRTGAAEELRDRLSVAVDHSEVLVGEDGWRIVASAQALEAAGMDASAVVAAATATDAIGISQALDLARFAGADPLGRARSEAPLADVLAAPGAQVAPDVASWQVGLARRLENWRDDFAKRLSAGEAPPKWAAPLGGPPPDAETRAAWAGEVAKVALYRATHHIEANSVLGPEAAPGTPTSGPRLRAQQASIRAQDLATRAGAGGSSPASPTLATAAAVAPARVAPPVPRVVPKGPSLQ